MLLSIFKGQSMFLSHIYIYIYTYTHTNTHTHTYTQVRQRDIHIYINPESSVGKETACNAGDPGSIPGLGRSAGEGIGYPLHYSWASLVAQLVKNPPAMQETWLCSLGWEDPLQKGKATRFSILAWRIQSMWLQSQTPSNFHSLHSLIYISIYQ